MPYVHAGWLRKRGRRNSMAATKKLFPWCRHFVVLHDGCFYYYATEMSKSQRGAFSLYGYDQVRRADDINSSEAPWALTILHKDPTVYKTYYFSAPSEQHLKDWMRHLKSQLKKANHLIRPERLDADGQSVSGGSLTYDEMESKIYDDPCITYTPSKNKISKFCNEDSDDDDVDSDGEGFYMNMENVVPISKRALPPLPSEGKRDRLPSKPEKAVTKASVLPKCKNIPSSKTGPKSPDVPAKPVKIAGAVEPTYEMDKVTTELNQVLRRGQEQRKDAPVTNMNKQRRRGPEGQSMTKKHVETQKLDEEDIQNSEEDKTAAYWKSVLYTGDKATATSLVQKIAQDGVYLVRDGEEGQVLVLYNGGVLRKFRIQTKGKQIFFNKGELFDSLAEMLYHYHTHDLREGVRLTTPFSQHPTYTGGDS